jgi:hypothetical protein
MLEMSGYGNRVANDSNSNKDVYVVQLSASTDPSPTAAICDDDIDNDGDSLSDCLDKRDCRQHPACKTTGGGGKNR